MPTVDVTVHRTPSGTWAVADEHGTIISEHPTNSQAWRAADRLSNEPINKREATSDWVFRKNIGSL